MGWSDAYSLPRSVPRLAAPERINRATLMMRAPPLPSRARWRGLYESLVVLLSAGAYVESAVHADRHVPGHVGTLTRDIKW